MTINQLLNMVYTIESALDDMPTTDAVMTAKDAAGRLYMLLDRIEEDEA